MQRTKALVKKDLLEEFRTRFTVNTLLMFALTSLVMVSFAVGLNPLSTELHAALLWIILFFSAMSGMARCFIKEEENKTVTMLRMAAPAEVVFAGKLCFNFVIMTGVSVLAVIFYLVMLNPPLANWKLFFLVIFMGIFGLNGASTILAAIVAKAGNTSTLLPVLALPVLLPLFITVIKATSMAMLGRGLNEVSHAILFLLAFAITIIAASLLLFDYVWNE